MLSKGVQQTKTDIQEVGSAAKTTATETDKIPVSLDKGTSSADALKGKLETLRNVGAGLAVISAGALVLANHFTEASIEASTLDAKMEGLLAGVGLEKASDQVMKLGTEIANIAGGDDDAIAASIAEAVASGRVLSLRQYGIVIDAIGQKSITAARNVSAQAGAQEALNQILKAAGPSLDTMKDSMNGAALAAHAFDNRWGNVEENLGDGTGVVKAALYNNVLSPLLDIAESHTGVIKTVGAIYAIGAAGLSAVSSILGLASQIGILIIARQTSAAATTEETVAVGANTAALGANATAADGAAVSNAALAASAEGAAAAEGTLATAAGITVASVTGIGVAIGAAGAAALYWGGQRIGILNKEIGFIDSVEQGYRRIKDGFGLFGNSANVAQNEIDFKNQEAKIEAQYDNDRAAGVSQVDAAKKRDAALSQLNDQYLAEAKKNKDAAAVKSHVELKDQLQQAMQPVTVPVVPIVTPPVVAPIAATASVPSVNKATAQNGPGFIDTSKAQMNTLDKARGAMMAQVANIFNNGGNPYSTINADGSVSDYPATEGTGGALQKITIHPKTKTSRTANGGFQIEILPEKIIIPNDFGNAVRGL